MASGVPGWTAYRTDEGLTVAFLEHVRRDVGAKYKNDPDAVVILAVTELDGAGGTGFHEGVSGIDGET